MTSTSTHTTPPPATAGAPEAAAALPKELRTNTAFLLKRLGWLVKDRAHDALEGTWMTPAHHGVLSLLEQGACGAQGLIADVLGYDRSQLVGLLDELEEHGFVERRRDPTDRRRHLVSLTPAGREGLAELRRISKLVQKEFLAPLDAEEQATLHALLLKLAAHHDARFAPGAGS